jgi:hypothetical protein
MIKANMPAKNKAAKCQVAIDCKTAKISNIIE